MKAKNLMIAIVALFIGAATGWFAAVAVKPSADAAGRARCPQRADDGSRHAAIPEAKPKRKAPARSAESNRKVPVEPSGENPKEDVGEKAVDNSAKSDNPFPRYLDMFKNNPEALAAEFLKEAEEDRANQRKMRDKAIAKLKLNAEQVAVFEKALDDLRDEITQQNREWAELVTSGRLNEDTAADGCIWSSNPLLAQRMVAAREMAVRETSEKLYEQLVIDGVSDAEVQNTLFRVVYNTSFSYECLEPDLAVYDKVYKNMGVGGGIFSWCRRPRQKK